MDLQTRILISNDDGVTAPGIHILDNALSKIAKTEVIAPDRNRSGASNSLTLLNPLRVKQLANGYHSVDGTPTDCVHMALTGYLTSHFDMVVSGINEGANLGDDVIYSGTVAAAMEGRSLGLPAIAISLVGHNVKNYESAASVASYLVLELKKHPLPQKTILNVNVPDLPLHEIKGIKTTRLGTRHLAEPTVKQIDPRGRSMYWIGPAGPEEDAGDGTDFDAIKQGYVSITPLQIDITNYNIFSELSDWTKGIRLT